MKVELAGVDLNKTSSKQVTEYPFYETRLKEIDWRTIEKSDEPFEDPYFKAELSSIFEESLPQRPGISGWAEFEWKRPSEVYGEDFSLYDHIDPNDIKQG